MIYSKFALVGAPTTRAKSYLQILCKNQILVNKAYILTKDPLLLESEWKEYKEEENPYFSPKEPLLFTLNKYKIPYELIPTEDINAPCMKETLLSMPEEFLLYSGFAGGIVSEELLSLGKKFIHVHAGILPSFRGSTTAYYSMLMEGNIGASAIFLSAGIDEGEIIAQKKFPPPSHPVDIDYVYEPYLRSLLLLEVLQDYEKKGCFTYCTQNHDEAHTYYVIHPVLKHIAVLGNDADPPQK